jgi:hypothetical protein
VEPSAEIAEQLKFDQKSIIQLTFVRNVMNLAANKKSQATQFHQPMNDFFRLIKAIV